jgi:Crinkler effector protein N-terminal domain
MANLDLKLFIYVIEVSTSSFPVKIKHSETIGDLKVAILQEKLNELGGVDADQLILYKVCLADNQVQDQIIHGALTKELH